MTEHKWTKGKWHVGAQNDALYIIDKQPRPSNDYPAHDFDAASIAKVYNGSHSDANARLIAAAPDLYEALDGMLIAAGSQGGTAREKARKALAKARSEQ